MSVEEIENWKIKFEQERDARVKAEALLEVKNIELDGLEHTLTKRIEEEVEKNREKELILFQQSKMAAMGEMIGNIAHQWRQPLSAISSLASGHILHNELGLLTMEESNKLLENIVKYTEFLSNTIDDFRNFFRNDKEYSLFFIDDAIEKSLLILTGMISVNSITIEKNIEHIEIFNLKNEFIQVILNLVKNAIDALVDVFDDDEKFIFIDGYVENENVIITIADTAGGIPMSIMERIFEPYFTTKHQSQGTGIGLFMSMEIIAKHMKGFISVKNIETNKNGEILKGASFKITIPLEY
jgi:two-component system, NtrC family, C4-dicarboxylate transport sensor histidine kinase DctB